jgi:hypothetical protein
MPKMNAIDPIEMVGTSRPNIRAGRVTEILTAVDDNTQSFTLAAADILAGISVHSSTSSGGTVTVDTAANIIANVPLEKDNECITSYYINDGNQTATFAVATGTTIANVANTVLTNEAAVLIWRRTSATTVKLYIASS